MPFSPEELLAKLGVKDVKDVLLDCEVFEERALEALKTDNLAGYHHVRPVKNSKLNPFQAMAYVGSKDQRGLGSFPTAREAAGACRPPLYDWPHPFPAHSWQEGSQQAWRWCTQA